MALNITERTAGVLNKATIRPHIILQINGVNTIYGSGTITEIVRIGDPGLLIGDDWVIGGMTDADDQESLISLSGTTTEISQQLSPERGAVSSISSMKVALVDKDELITRLISPGQVVTDMMGRRARVWLGFEGTSFPDDYITVFRGIIDDIESEQGLISLNLAHPDQKKRNTIYERAETVLNGNHNSSIGTITVTTTENFLVGVAGPSGGFDTSFESYIRIDDEIIQYTGKTATTFTGCTRGELDTVANSHDTDTEVTSFYRLTGNGVTLALKLMLSGWGGSYQEDVAVTNFVTIGDGTSVANSMFFENINIPEIYGLIEGDYITTTGASNGANNVSAKQILTIVVLDGSTYIVVDGVTFVSELDTAAVVDFRSQYDTLPNGLKLHGDEVDIDSHILWYRRFLSSFDYDFYLKDSIEGKDFIEKQIYLPMAAYSLPRKSRASMGYHTGPVPNDEIVTIDASNCTNPHQLKIRRSMGKNFYNTIVYKFEVDTLEDKYLFGYITSDTDSKARIEVGNKSLTIQADGLRRALAGENSAAMSSSRLLNRYRYAAEFIDNVKVLFSAGFKMEAGDIIIFDGTDLNVSDIVNSKRGSDPRLFEIINKKLNIKTGEVTLSLVDTNLSLTNRYGLISPASIIASATDQRTFVIQQSYGATYGVNEWRKWQRYIGYSVKVRNSDFSQDANSVILNVLPNNTVTLTTPLGFVPSAGHVMELSHYNNQGAEIKLFYTFMTDAAAFDDAGEPYRML